MAESFLSKFLGRLTGSRREDQLARYVIAETKRGRTLADVLDDPYVRNRSDETTLNRLMDHPELVQALGRDRVDEIRAQLTSRPG